MYLTDVDRAATSVLVVKDGMAAATAWAPGPTFTEGFASKAHVTTDRPAYRPGQSVAFRAVYRRATGGAYEVPAGVKAVAVLLDGRGAEVERTDIVASDLGTFDGRFALDAAAPLGVWTVRLRVDDKTFDGRFHVLAYRTPEFAVTVTPGKPSYRTGDEVAATVRLAYLFGGPVVGAPVRWEVVRVPRDFTPTAVDDYAWYFQDPDALARAREAARTAPRGAVVARGEATTDAKGAVAVAFATQARDEDAEYVVTASAIDVTRRFVTDEGRIPVVRRDHAAVVRTDRRVYRPQQEIRATFTTVDANQTPVGKAGSAVLVRVRRTLVPAAKGRPERWNEEEVAVVDQPAVTDAKGRVEVRLRAPAPGAYRMRWQSVDARGAAVTAYVAFDVAGAAEDLAKDVRLVAAKEAYVEGERAEVLLQSPVTGTRALLTFEGEKVLGYRLVDVEGPSTVLDVPIEAAYAPNVVMKVAVPGKDRLLEAEDELVVFRYLQVEVTPSVGTARPGDEVRFDVTTKDAAGNPVAAEVGLSVVDEALFGVAPDLAPAIRPFFYDRKRSNRVVTSSSVGYRTYGSTRPANQDLLADAAARSGDPDAVAAAGHLRQARAAMERGAYEDALGWAETAVARDPSSWDARNLVAELQTRPEVQSRTKERLSVALAENADLRHRVSDLEAQYGEATTAHERAVAELTRKQAEVAAARARPSDQPRLGPAVPSRQMACGSGKCGSGDAPARAPTFKDGHADRVDVVDLDDVTNGLASDPGAGSGGGGGNLGCAGTRGRLPGPRRRAAASAPQRCGPRPRPAEGRRAKPHRGGLLQRRRRRRLPGACGDALREGARERSRRPLPQRLRRRDRPRRQHRGRRGRRAGRASEDVRRHRGLRAPRRDGRDGPGLAVRETARQPDDVASHGAGASRAHRSSARRAPPWSRGATSSCAWTSAVPRGRRPRDRRVGRAQHDGRTPDRDGDDDGDRRGARRVRRRRRGARRRAGLVDRDVRATAPGAVRLRGPRDRARCVGPRRGHARDRAPRRAGGRGSVGRGVDDGG